MKPALLLLFLAALALPAAAAPETRRVYKIDSVIATIKGRTLTLTVKGAVQSGGWTLPHLHAQRGAPPHTMILEFLGAPPPPGAAVIEGLLPVATTTRLRVRPGIVAVEVQAEANAITTQVLH